MPRTVIIDVGTHQAEELKVLSGYFPYIIYSYSCWWFDYVVRIIKYIFFQKTFQPYGVGPYTKSPISISLANHIRILTIWIHQSRKCFHTLVFAIDPQFAISYPSLQRLRKYMTINYLPLALSTHVNSNTSIFYFHISKNSLSSSLLPSSASSSQTLVPSFKTSDLLEQLLSLGCISFKDPIILRINSEGSELSIISDFIQSGLDLKLVIGSINDVLKKFGHKEYKFLTSLLAHGNISYIYFKGSDPSTWLNGLSSLNPFLIR
jgi:hypothetical protein